MLSWVNLNFPGEWGGRALHSTTWLSKAHHGANVGMCGALDHCSRCDLTGIEFFIIGSILRLIKYTFEMRNYSS